MVSQRQPGPFASGGIPSSSRTHDPPLQSQNIRVRDINELRHAREVLFPNIKETVVKYDVRRLNQVEKRMWEEMARQDTQNLPKHVRETREANEYHAQLKNRHRSTSILEHHYSIKPLSKVASQSVFAVLKPLSGSQRTGCTQSLQNLGGGKKASRPAPCQLTEQLVTLQLNISSSESLELSACDPMVP